MNITKKEITITPWEANLYAFFGVLPIVVLLWAIFIKMVGKNNFWANAIPNGVVFFSVIILGIFIHEILHGIGWSFFAEKGFKSIKFGFSLKAFAPYCHCKEELRYFHFVLGVFLPALVLGIIPVILAFILKNSQLFLYGIIFLFGAGGDLVILAMLIKNYDSSSYIMDHPDKIGCIMIKKGDT